MSKDGWMEKEEKEVFVCEEGRMCKQNKKTHISSVIYIYTIYEI